LILIFYFFFIIASYNTELVNIELNEIKYSTSDNILILILSLPVIAFIIYYGLKFGIRLNEDFIYTKEDRSPLDFYVYVYIVSLFISTRYNKIIMIIIFICGIVYILSSERLKGYIYLLTLLLIIFNIHKKNIISALILIGGFFVADIISALRTGLGLSGTRDGINISHFGEVTVSSMYLLDLESNFSMLDRLKFSIGTILGNIIPSSLLPSGMNIREYLGEASNIPGGGWLPVYLYVMTGFIGVSVGGYLLGLFYKKIVKEINRCKIYSDKKILLVTIFIIFTATLPNWYMYTPFQVIKMSLYGFLISYLMLGLINLIFNKK
jgi:hypothetical protein